MTLLGHSWSAASSEYFHRPYISSESALPGSCTSAYFLIPSQEHESRGRVTVVDGSPRGDEAHLRPGYHGDKRFLQPHGRGRMVYRDGAVSAWCFRKSSVYLAVVGILYRNCRATVGIFLSVFHVTRFDRCTMVSGEKVDVTGKAPCNTVHATDTLENGKQTRRTG